MYRRIIENTESFANRTRLLRRDRSPPRVSSPVFHMEEDDRPSRISEDGFYDTLSVQLNVNSDPSVDTISLSLDEDHLSIKMPAPHVDVQSSAVERIGRRRHISSSSSSSESDCSPPKRSCRTHKVSEDFLRLFKNPDSFPDAILKCGFTEIPVHKCILSVRSPVFGALFKSQMKEANSNFVDIVDIEPDVLEAMLKYVYGGKTDHITTELAAELLFAADKYQIDGLKSDCIKKLKMGLTQNNALHILVLGEMHDKSLKTQALVYIAKHVKFSEVDKTEEWKLLQTECSELAMEVLLAVVKDIPKRSCSEVKIDTVTFEYST